MNRFVIIARNALVVAALAASVPAVAEDQQSVNVRYGDLDLSSPAGQHHLHDRLVAAARKACEDNLRSGTIAQPAFAACTKQAMAKADRDFAALVGQSPPAVASR
jgi:UrcA family protein